MYCLHASARERLAIPRLRWALRFAFLAIIDVLVGDEDSGAASAGGDSAPHASGTVGASLRDMTTNAPLAAVAAANFPESPAAYLRRTSWFGPATAYVPALGLVLSGYWGLQNRERGRALYALGGTLGFALVRWQLARFFTEQAPYQVERRIGEIEVRRYAPTVRAETTLADTTWSDALDQGFERIAGYIFGANQQDSRVEMTAPVLAQVGESDRADRNVSFIMPSNRPLDTLPIPRDSRVHLRAAPPRRMAALPFRGRYGGTLPAQKRAELLQLVHAAGLSARGDVEFAGYDAPSTLPVLRRNEVLVEIASDATSLPAPL